MVGGNSGWDSGPRMMNMLPYHFTESHLNAENSHIVVYNVCSVIAIYHSNNELFFVTYAL